MKLLLVLIFIFQIHLSIGQVDTTIWDYFKLQIINQKYNNGYHIIKKNGITIREFRNINGKVDGIYKEYYDNGKIKFISDHKAYYTSNPTFFCGVYKEFYESGKLKIDGNYKLVDSIECLNCFDLNDNKVKTKAYGHSLKVGDWKEYYENGILKSIGVYYKGIHETYGSHNPKQTNDGVGIFTPGDYSEEYLKDKGWKYYNDKGQLIKEEYYYNGVITNIHTYEQ